MAKLKKPENDRLNLEGKKGEWADECLGACRKAGLIIPIVTKWFKKDEAVSRTITIPARFLSMAEEILDNNRTEFKTLADVFRMWIYIAAILTYRMIVTNREKECFGSWGKSNYTILVQMQATIGDFQKYDNHVRVMQEYFEGVSSGQISIDSFRNMCSELIDSAPEDKKGVLWKAYAKITNREKVADLFTLGGWGGKRENSGRKKVNE